MTNLYTLSEQIEAEKLCSGCRHLAREDGYPLPWCAHPTVMERHPKGLHLPNAAEKFCGADRKLKETPDAG